ncbi:epoxyqueuosine reductase QueH [Candidatus Woesearchaeota archaeon]|nr:epoxyqueuosine reductase QueH [Candidatus Woesearchaeota archaeon]
MKQKMLLHVCCAPCATHVINELKKDYDLTLYFVNPNIHKEDEHKKRLNEVKKLAFKLKLPLLVGRYNIDKWFNATKGQEKEKEGGKRCSTCFYLRLEDVAKLAKKNKFHSFTTTLTVSPHKNSTVINLIGKRLKDKHKVDFLEADFKKGYKKSIELSKKYNFYRQNYCGCLYSIR